MTPEEKRILSLEIPKYIRENCYYTDGTLNCYSLWLVGWVAAEFHDRKNAMRVLINNEYGLLGNLLNKLAREPDEAFTRLIERTDLEVILAALKEAGNSVLSRNKLDADPYAMRLLIAHDKAFIKYVKADLLRSKSFLLSVVGCCPEILQNVLNSMFNDEEFVCSLIKKNYVCLKYLPQRYCSDYGLCLKAARNEGFSLLYFDFHLQKEDEIVLAAVSNRGTALSLASPQQKKNREIVFAAVSNCGLALDYANDLWKKDFELVRLAVSNRGMALRYASSELKDCEEIVRCAIQNDGYAIRFASERLQNDRELALLAIKNYTNAYKYFSPKLQNDPEIKKLYLLKKEEENKWLPSKMR